MKGRPSLLEEAIGMRKEELDTPALLVDLDLLDMNIKTAADYYHRKEGAALRPHQKGHRLPAVARKQIEAGATGVSMTSLGLAEHYVGEGVSDILITSEVYGRGKIRRLCTLAERGDITVGVDSLENARQLSKAAIAGGTKLNVGVELYAGVGGCGVPMKDAPKFARGLRELRGVHFKGLWWHEGSTGGIKKREERKKAEFRFLDRVAGAKAEIEGDGMEVETLSGGQSSTWDITPEYPGLAGVEVQAGNYVFSDWVDRMLEGLEVFQCALTVLTRCISRPGPRAAMFDSGMNTCSDEAGSSVMGGYSRVVGPRFKDLEGVRSVSQREEVMLAKLTGRAAAPRVGDSHELIPPHADTTAKLHDRYYVVRKGKVVAVWPNSGRGLF